MNTEIYYYIAVILLGILATARVFYDYHYKNAPDWLTLPFIFGFSMLMGGLVADAYIKFFW